MAVVLTSDIQRWAGLSTDTKPTVAPAGSLFYETDSGMYYVWNGTAWSPMAKAGPNVCRKLITFTGAANLGAVGAAPLFTVTGTILIRHLVARGAVTLTEAAPTATIALGVTGSTSLFIGATTATAITNLTSWISTTPNATGLALPAAMKDIVIVTDLIATIAAQAVNGGALRVTAFWEPMEAGSTLVAA